MGVTVAARPRLSHNLQADGEEEPVFQPKSWVSSRQGSLSPDRSAAGLPFSAAISAMPQSLAGLARKAPLPACVLNCMPLADVSQNPYLYSQFFRSFQDYKRMGLAKITSLSGRNSELTLQSRLPLPSLPTPLSSLGLTSLQDQEEESQLIISRTLGRGFKEGQQLLLR